MKVATPDRRVPHRRRLKAPLRVRIWKSSVPEWEAESENLSEPGIFFAMDSALQVGMAVEVFLEMPEEIAGESTTEWLYTGHIVRVEPVDSADGRLGVGVQFDCYEFTGAK
jgi:hypothetical protein